MGHKSGEERQGEKKQSSLSGHADNLEYMMCYIMILEDDEVGSCCAPTTTPDGMYNGPVPACLFMN